MAISGLVITISDDEPGAAALRALHADARLEVGDRFGRRVAVVADTGSVRADRDLWDELRQMPGVTHVDVTYVHLDPESPAGDDVAHGLPMEDQHAQR